MNKLQFVMKNRSATLIVLKNSSIEVFFAEISGCSWNEETHAPIVTYFVVSPVEYQARA